MEMRNQRSQIWSTLIEGFSEADYDTQSNYISEVVDILNVNDHSEYKYNTDETIDKDSTDINDLIQFTIAVKLSDSEELFYLLNTVEVLS